MKNTLGVLLQDIKGRGWRSHVKGIPNNELFK
jgi:hypothetical protein